MEPQSADIDLQSRIRRLERMGLLALALLVAVGAQLAWQLWSGGERGNAVAVLLDQNRKPHAVVEVSPSGEIRLVSLRPDGSLPQLDPRNMAQQSVALFDAAGHPRVVFGTAAAQGALAQASILGAQPAAQTAATSASGSTAHSCNLTHPAGAAHETQLAAAGTGPKKEEGEAASVREERAPDGSRIKTVLFENLKIDGIAPSMTGPRKTHRLALGSAEDKQVWVTRFRAEVLDRDNKVASPQFMCHSALDVVGRSGSAMAPYRGQAFTVSQGQTEIAFPPGFAMTVPNEPDMQQDVLVQVLNNNDPKLRRELNFRTTLQYFGEKDARERKLIPLKLTGGSVTPIIDPAVAKPQEAVARPAFKEEIFTGSDGRRRSGHWLVPPGRQVLTTEVPLNLAENTTVHYMWMHVHPYAKSMELRDVTANRSVWKGLVQNDPDPKRAAVVNTDTYSSPKGLELHHDHRYELVATYENPTQGYVDAMASLWMYVRAD
jgi:hypothetical protein